VADEVEITNVGNGGTVASEETLAKLLAAMEKMGGGSGAAGKAQQLYNTAIVQGTKGVTTNTQEQKKNSDATNAATASINTLGIAASALKTGLGQLLGGVVGLGTELINGGDTVADFAKHVPLVGGYLGALAGLIDQNVESFRALSQVGATFGDGMNDIRAISAQAGIPLGEFTDLVSQNSQTMRLFGAGTADGARNFARLSKELREGPGKAFRNMGYTATELNEALIDYAEFSQNQIGVERRDNRMSAQSAAAYLETIDQLAAVTGKRRDQIREEMNAAQADQRARLAMSRMTEEEQTRFAANLANTPPALADALNDAADGVMDNDLAQGLSVASETFRQQAGNIQNMNAQEYNNFMATVGRELDAAGVALGAGAEQVMKSGTGYGQAISLAADLRNTQMMDDAEFARLQADRAAQAARDDGILNLQNSLRELRTGLMDAFINSGALASIQAGLSKLGEIVGTKEFQDGLKTAVEGLIAGLKMVASAVGTVVEFLGSIGDTFGTAGVVAALVAGIAGLFAAKAVVGALAGAAKGAISRGIEGRLSGIFGGGGSPGASGASPRAAPPRAGAAIGRNAAAAGGGIGKGLGNLGGGILKGIAAGLKAFANPQVAIGAAVVAGVILVIGAAIAGASWLLGKSLPTLVDGIKSFEEIDGAALKSTAVGMLALSGAMAAFGAGSAVAGLGAMVGGITGAIGKLFGADDPLEQLKQFAAADIDASKVKSNAEAMAAFSTAMAAGGAGSAAEGLGSLVSGIAGGIGALFGGSDTDDIVADMIKFAAVDVDTAKVKNNAEAMIAFSSAMAAAAGGSAVGGLGTLVSGIAGGIGALFGGDTTDDTFEQLKRFSTYDIDTAKVKNNAEAMSAFSAAMSTGSAAAGAGAVASIGNAIASFFGGDTPLDQVKEFGEMQLNVAQIEANANAIRLMSTSLTGFSEADLDETPIISYTEAIEALTEALGNLNEELSRDNDTLLTSRADAGELLSGINASSTGSNQGISSLNSTMQAMLVTLGDLKDINTKVERNTQAITSGNLAAGSVSRTGT
jgi:hypothetical protein